MTQNAIKIEKLTVHGGDYDTPDGSAVRDYIDVNDLADAHVISLTNQSNKFTQVYDSFNLGKGSGVSVLDLIATFEKVRSQIKYEILARDLETFRKFMQIQQRQKLF